MKKTELAEIKKTDLVALKKKAKEARQEIGDLMMDKNTNKMSNLRALKNKRKDLAQIMTVLNQKQLLEELEKNNG